MASLEKRNNIYRIVFRLDGQKFSRSLRTKSKAAADLALAQLKDGLHRIKLGVLTLDPSDDVVTALMSSGNIRQKQKTIKSLRLGKLLDEYLASIPENSIEQTTRGMLNTHIRHLKRLIGVRASVKSVNLTKLQAYVNDRSQEPGIRGRTVSPVTTRKEVTTLYAAWTWAKEAELIPAELSLPRKARLRYPKQSEKPPFKTWDEINRLIARGKLTAAQQRDQWDCVFLNDQEIRELLSDVERSNVPNAIKLMFATAAYTGMRRSEMLRCQLEDIDLESNTITIREKKRVRGKRSTRSVPICTALKQVLVVYLNSHPGGLFSFTADGNSFTANQVRNYFETALNKTKFKVLQGWHVLRHSFISNCAAKNIDQRIIDGWVGHQTEQQRQRYRHLFPNVQKAAIESVFAL